MKITFSTFLLSGITAIATVLSFPTSHSLREAFCLIKDKKPGV